MPANESVGSSLRSFASRNRLATQLLATAHSNDRSGLSVLGIEVGVNFALRSSLVILAQVSVSEQQVYGVRSKVESIQNWMLPRRQDWAGTFDFGPDPIAIRPAMEAGVTDQLWEMSDLVALSKRASR